MPGRSRSSASAEVSIMKRISVGLAACLLIVSGAGAGQAWNRLSFRLSPGGILAVDGCYNDTDKLSKVVNIGAGLNAALRYRVNDYLALDAGYAFQWLSVKKAQRPYAYKEQAPALNIQMISLNGMFFLGSGYAFEPYLTAGIGIYPWRFSRTALWGKPWPAPSKPAESFSDTSPGFNFGLGVESYLFSKVFLAAELKYHYLWSRNVAKFGTDDFTQQDFLGLTVGFIYRFGKT